MIYIITGQDNETYINLYVTTNKHEFENKYAELEAKLHLMYEGKIDYNDIGFEGLSYERWDDGKKAYTCDDCKQDTTDAYKVVMYGDPGIYCSTCLPKHDKPSELDKQNMKNMKGLLSILQAELDANKTRQDDDFPF